MKKNILTIAFALFTISLFGQPDCVIFFRYKGVIVSDSSKIHKIGLPTTPFIVGYEKKTDSRAFVIHNISDSSFDITLASHLSSDFCRTSEDIVAFVFKRIKEYPIKLFDSIQRSGNKNRPTEAIVPLDSIKFTYEIVDGQKEIVIDLGHIKG